VITTSQSREGDRPRKAALWALLGLLAMSCLYFLFRGPYRALDGLDGEDLTGLYAATLAWIAGNNPYDPQVLADMSVGAGIDLGPAWSLHPPPTFVLLAPLAAMPWAVAEKVSALANILLQLVSIAMVMSLADLRPRQPRGLLFLAFAFALAPFHTAIAEGQLAIAVTALVVASLTAKERQRPLVSGVCIALAAALKPQMGLIFLLLLLVRGQWKALLSAVSALGIIAAVGVTRLAVGGVDWLPTLMSNLGDSGVSDPTQPSTQRLNLQALLNVVLPGQDPVVIDVLTYGTGVAALAILFLALRRRTDLEADLLLFAGCAVVTLLMVYNRSYSATLLVLPLGWAFASFRPRALWLVAVVISGATAVFVVPGAAALAHLALPSDLQWVSQTTWWRLLQVHQIVALLTILAGLLVAATYQGARARGLREVDP
jgi:uncharacterized membrane protein